MKTVRKIGLAAAALALTCAPDAIAAAALSQPAAASYPIHNLLSGKCLEIGFGGIADFNAANQFTCHGSRNQ